MGVIDLFARSSATVVFDDGVERSTHDLIDGARQVLAQLRNQGIQQGDRVALHRANDRTAVELLLAASLGSFVAVAVNTRYSTREVDDLVTRSGARHPELDTTTERRADDDVSHDRRDDPFVIFTTSGTTSKPKMVLHRQRSIVDHAEDVVRQFGYRSDDTIVVALPLCGTFGLASLIAAVAADARVIVHNFTVDGTTSLSHREHITAMNGSDDMFHRLLGAQADLSHIRIGGFAQFNASLTDICQRVDAVGGRITGLYGMSEVQALFSLRDPSTEPSNRARAGGTLVSSAAGACVVDGELWLRGPSLFDGYLHEGGDSIDPELTGRHFVTDDNGVAWFRTGDLAEMDDIDTFHYISRLGDVLRLGGFLVAPAEITEVLCSAPNVSDAQVVSVELPTGSRPVAFVITENGTVADEAAVIQHCSERLAKFKVPIRVVTVEEFPITDGPNGVKIRLTELRDRAKTIVAPTA